MGKRRSKANKTKKPIVAISFVIIAIICALMVLNGSKSTSLSLSKLASKLFGGPMLNGQAVESISMEEDGYSVNGGEPGTWHVTESAHWTDIDKAEAKIEVTSHKRREDIDFKSDIILVLDISGSMTGLKIERAIRDSKEIVETVLEEPSNKVALIVYDDQARLLSDFTSNKENLLEILDSVTPDGSTNYNDPLKYVDSLMENYVKQDGREVKTVFLTDGQPNVDVPNQKATYQLLKRKYPYMAINGIQYEMGEVIKQDLIDVTDRQWIASINTLNNVLFEVTGLAETIFNYDKFELENIINTDLFTVESENDIDVSNGTVQLIEENGEQKLIWTLDNSRSGFGADMRIKLKLKDEYKYQTGYYPTSTSTQVSSSIAGENVKVKRTTDTPILEKKSYSVIYDINAPDGETVTGAPENETHFPYEVVTKSQSELQCDGWVFKGWEVITENLDYINDDMFNMPAKDVTIRAIWSKLQIAITMDGTVANKIDIHIGDTVLYSPTGTFTWDPLYTTDFATNSVDYGFELEEANLSNNEFVEYNNLKITEWKVLDVNERTGSIEIVPSTTVGLKTLKLQGAQGYNNGVYMLNAACNALYGDSSKSITARNIAEEDFEKAGKRENTTDTDTENAWTRMKVNSATAAVAIDRQGRLVSGSMYYPYLYELEEKCVINGITYSSGLKPSEQNELITRNQTYKKTATSLQPYNRGYTINRHSTLITYLDSEKASVLFPNGSNTKYWVATRNIHANSNNDTIIFGLRNIWEGTVGYYGGNSCLIGKGGTTNYSSCPLFPIVTVSNRLIEPTENDGEFRVK